MLKKKAFLWFAVVLFTLNVVVNVLSLIIGAGTYTFLQSLLVFLKVLVYGFLTWNVWTRLQYIKKGETLPKWIDTSFSLTILAQVLLIVLA